MYGRPGNSLFSNGDLPAGAGQGIIALNGHTFFAQGGRLYEVFSDHTWVDIGSVGTTGPVSMAANSTQIIITSSTGGGWLFTPTDVGAYGPITAAGFPQNCDSVTFIDGYFVAAENGTQKFFISGIEDGLTWDPLDFAEKEANPDFMVANIMVRRQLWVMGSDTSEVWWNSGQANFPFQPIQGALLQYGCGAVRTPTIVGNNLFWLGRNSRGKAIAFTEQNFGPIRVSNHAIESAWESYATTSDAIGYGVEFNGHNFFVISFPTADVAWALDTKLGFWYKWDWWDVTTGVGHAVLARFHAFCFDKHLVLNGQYGGIYEQSMDTYTDPDWGDSTVTGVIRRLRRSPHVDKDKHRDRHVRLELDMETGTVPVDTNPVYSLRYSDDGGFTWGNEMIRPIGQTGKYGAQVVWRQLGSARDRVYEVVCTEAIPTAWAACYLETAPSTERQ